VELITQFIDIFIHLDKHLSTIIESYGAWTYAILFLIVFCETGLVVTPILPEIPCSLPRFLRGDRVPGPLWLFGLLTAAGVLGDTVNYGIGHYFGPRVFHFEDSGSSGRNTWNARTLSTKSTAARRSSSPGSCRSSGPSRPSWPAWEHDVPAVHRLQRDRRGPLVGGFVFGGYLFGNIPAVKRNFTLVIMVIIFLSILPGIIEFLRHKLKKNEQAAS